MLYDMETICTDFCVGETRTNELDVGLVHIDVNCFYLLSNIERELKEVTLEKAQASVLKDI